MKHCEKNSVTYVYIPEMFNDITNKWIDVEPFKKPYSNKNQALKAIKHRKSICKADYRLRIEKHIVDDVSFESV